MKIPCTYAMSSSALGILGYSLCVIGVLICGTFLVVAIVHRKEKILRRSQLIFVYISIVGSILMNVSIIAFIGPNSSVSCIMRPWSIDVSSTLMFAPLIMKLHRVDKLFNNPTLKKITISNYTVIGQVLGLLSVDVIILLIWSVLETPRSVTKDVLYSSVLSPVPDVVCNTGLRQGCEVAMVIFKSLMIAFGIMKVSNNFCIILFLCFYVYL